MLATIVGCADGEPEGRVVEVTAAEYEFRGIPSQLPPGRVTFRISNQGAENHNFVLTRVLREADILEVLELSQPERARYLEDVGATDAVPPGGTGRLSASLEAGRYVYLCLVTTEAGRPHAFVGMRGELIVR